MKLRSFLRFVPGVAAVHLGTCLLAISLIVPGPARVRAAAAAPDGNNRPAVEAEQPENQEPAKRGVDRAVLFRLGQDAELRPSDSADAVVVIGGGAKVFGKVRNAVVVIDGDVEVDGDVNDAVVVILGNVHLRGSAHTHDDVVAVMGNITVDKGATIKGDAVAVGGTLDVADGAHVGGQSQEIGMNLGWLRAWLVQCVFKLRPLALQVGWVWAIAAAFFLFYFLVAAMFPRPVQVCVEQLEERPLTTFFLGLLAKLIIVPVVAVLLIATGIGVLVVPFAALALFAGVVVGKVALLEWVGLRVGQQSGFRFLQRPLVAFVFGALVLTLFYLVWVVGLVAYSIFAVWGLGVATTAVIGGWRRRNADRSRTPGPSAGAPGPAPGTFSTPGPASGFPSASPWPGPSAAATPPDPMLGIAARMPDAPSFGLPPGPPPAMATARGPVPPTPPVMPDVLVYPKAGFWERLAAAFLDVVLLAILAQAVPHHPWSFLLALAYFTVLWTWRGTTVGMIVLGLKVVRVDGQPLAFTVALVRALAMVFSCVVFFLGFLWIGWDPDKQGWHDKIAGTVVLRMPRGTPLVCV